MTGKAPSLKDYVDYANELFNDPNGVVEPESRRGSYGFIEYSTNLHADNTNIIPDISIPYGFENVWHKRKTGYRLERIKAIKGIRKIETKIYERDLNLISLEDIFDLFEFEIYMQNNYGALLEDATGKRIVVKRGRYNLDPGARASFIQKRLRKELQPFKRVIMLSTTIHQPKVQAVMPDNTNLLPIEYAIIHAWEWHGKFLKRLRQHMERRSIPWGYIGSVLHFQDSDDMNGFPQFHALFDNAWLGNIDDIAAMWPYSERQGVDIRNKAKWEKEHPGQKYTPLRLAKYLAKYLSKCLFFDNQKGVHKCHAIAAYYRVRMFNMAHEFKATKSPKNDSKSTWKYIEIKSA